MKLIDIWLKRVHKTKTCWLWTGASAGRMGYGRIQVSGVVYMAHRLTWELFKGPVPKGLWVLHKCDNPPCVNPKHLFLGTNSTNQVDASNKKRHNHSRKTHCINGHKLDADNTHSYLKNGRTCRVCRTCKEEARKRNRIKAIRSAKGTPEEIARKVRCSVEFVRNAIDPDSLLRNSNKEET